MFHNSHVMKNLYTSSKSTAVRAFSEHDICRQGSTLLPKRVIDIFNRPFRSITTKPGQPGFYAALSCCRGDRGVKINTSRNWETLERGYNRDPVPVAFQDMAKIAYRLNVKYLWIDILYIIQDDIGDW